MKVFIADFNNVLTELYPYVDHVDRWEDADVVVLWQDVIGEMKNIAELAKDRGKRVIVAEHGLLSINDYIPPLNRPLVADTFMTWGNWTKDWLVKKAGIDREKIKVTGSLIFRHLGRKLPHEGKNVLFAPRHWNVELEENLDIADELRQLKDVNVRSKIIFGEHDPSKYPNPIISNRQVYEHIGTCKDALRFADVVVTIGEGTIASMAYYMGIPVINVNLWYEKELLGKVYTSEEFFSQVSPAAIDCDIIDLNETIYKVLRHPKINLAKRNRFLKYALNYPADPLREMLNVIYGET